MTQLTLQSLYEVETRIDKLQKENSKKLSLHNLRLIEIPDSVIPLTYLEGLYLSGNHISIIPKWIGSFTNLKILDISDNQLDIFPDEVGNLTSLQFLVLWNNQLTIIPDWLGKLTTLRGLYLSDNRLKTLPHTIGNLTNLVVLDLSKNSKLELPRELGDLPALQKLSISEINLQSLPFWIGDLVNLQNLNVSRNKFTSLPESIGNLTKLKGLDLSGNQLTTIPDWISNLSELQELNLSGNNFSSLPESIGNLTKLKVLDLSGNQLTTIPDWISNLSELQELNLSGNKIYRFPKKLGDLGNLKKLSLSNNTFSIIPDSIFNLTDLEELNISGIKLLSLPEKICNLIALKSLDLSANRLTTLPIDFGKLVNLQNLDITRNKLSTIPDSLGNLSNLKSLYLTNNALTEIPECIGNLINLDILGLQKNSLTRIPILMGNLVNLEDFDLSENQLTFLPDTFGNLKNLKSLLLSQNKFLIVPDCIGSLTNLQELDLSNNKLSTFPTSISNLNKIKRLDFSKNQIDEIPNWVSTFENLKFLFFDKNRLNDIPSILGRLAHIERITLDGNPLNPDLEAAYSQGTDTFLEYLRERTRQEVILSEAKLVIVGEGAVGKSSLLGALKGDPWIDNRITTHGVEIRSILLTDPQKGVKITLNGWDFGGQPVYRPTHQLFFSAPAVYLVVWKPREGPEQGFVEYWIKLIKNRTYQDPISEDYPRILIVATHGGPKERQAHIDEEGLRKQFGKLIIGFYHVDSHSKDGLDELKNAIAKSAASIPHVGRKVPASWKRTIDIIKEQSELKPYISYSDFENFCHELGITKDLISTYARILHELGYIIYYADDEGLKDIIILKPDWLSRAISFVLEDKTVKDGHGLVLHSHLGRIWNSPEKSLQDRYPHSLHPIFLQLMERFDLSYRLVTDSNAKITNNSESSLIAQLVPGDRPKNLAMIWTNKLNSGESELTQVCQIVDVEFKNPARAEGIMYQLIVREHRYSLGRDNYVDSCHWQMGMVLDDDYNGRAFIEQIGTDIYITVRAAYPERFLHLLCEEIKWLVEHFWKGLRCKISIPCPITPGCRGLLGIEEMIISRRKKHTDYPCPVCSEWVNIDTTLSKPVEMPDYHIALAELKQGQNEILKGLRSSDMKLTRLISQADERFAALMTALTDEARDGPRLFSITLVEPGFWGSDWVNQKIRITLWCEHSRLPLPVLCNNPTYGVFEFQMPRQWLKKIAPYAIAASTVLSLVLPIAGSTFNKLLDEQTSQQICSIQSELTTAKDAFSTIGEFRDKWTTYKEETVIPDEVGQSNQLGLSYCSSSQERPIFADGALLRELHILLKEKDPMFSGLKRIQNRKFEYLWIHPQFEKEYYLDPPVIPHNEND